MSVFKTRKNKKYSYTPRFYKNDGEGNPFEIKHKFDDYRKTVGTKGGLKTRINNALSELNEPDKAANRRILIITVILLLVFLVIIDFDLSIFF